MKILFKNHHFFSNALLILALIFVNPKQSFSQTFPDKPSSKLVNDFAKIYSTKEEGLLEEKLVEYNNKTSTQIAIVTITSLGGYPIDDYTTKLANRWGIGQKEKNNGLLILIAAQDHKVFIASGYGMEGVLNDGKLGTIIRTQMVPQFKDGNYYAGTNDGIDAIIAAATGEYVNNDSNKDTTLSSSDVLALIILFLFCIVFAGRSYNSSSKRGLSNSTIFYGSSNVANKRENSRFGGGGFDGFGGGGFGGGGSGGSW